MCCSDHFAECISVPRNNAILSGIANVLVASISGLEMVIGQLFIFIGFRDFHLVKPTPYKVEEENEKPLSPKIESNPSSQIAAIAILLLVLTTGVLTLFACNTKTKRQVLGNFTRLFFALSILVSGGVWLFLSEFSSATLIWGSLVQIMFWSRFETYLKEPGLEPVSTGSAEWRQRENEEACWQTHELCCPSCETCFFCECCDSEC